MERTSIVEPLSSSCVISVCSHCGAVFERLLVFLRHYSHLDYSPLGVLISFNLPREILKHVSDMQS